MFPLREVPAQSNRDECGRELARLAELNPDIIVFDADVCTSTRISHCRDRVPAQFIQSGIAEANMAAMAAGLAAVHPAFIPVISGFACFMARRALDQIAVSIAYPRLNVKIIGAYGGIPTGNAGATHQAFEDLAVMRSIPGMVVLAPADGPETRAAVRAALAWQGPVYLRTARDDNTVIFPDHIELAVGRATVLRPGTDLTVISTGTRTQAAIRACETLQADFGIHAEHLHCPCLKPFDAAALVDSARHTGAVLSVEDHSIIGGLGSAAAEILAEACPVRLTRLGIRDHFGESGPDALLYAKYHLAEADIVDAARKLMETR